MCNQSFSLTQSCSVSPFLSPFSLSIWLSHCCAVNVSLCLTHSCSVNHFSRPFFTLVASMCAVNCSYFSPFCQSFALMISVILPQFCAVHLPLSPWFWQSFSSHVLSGSSCLHIALSIVFTRSLTLVLSIIFFLALSLSILLSQFCAVNISLSHLFCHFFSLIIDHCCCLALVL